MRVEIKLDADIMEPYAVLHIRELTPEISAALELLESSGAAPQLLAANKDGKAYVMDPRQLELLRTEGGSVCLYDRAANRFTMDKPLGELTQRLGRNFIRISKSAAVNIRRIDHVSPSFNGTMDIIMKNGMNDYISRKFLGEFKRRLGL